MSGPRETIDAPYQIICEGRDDMEFYRRLVRDCRLGHYNVGFGEGRDGRPLGKDGFKVRIDSVMEFGPKPLQGIVIVADSDDKPIERFNDAVKHFSGFGLPQPKHPLQEYPSQDPALPKTAIIMIPSYGVEGGLETLALQCCDQVQGFRDCIDTFCQCVYTPRRSLDCDKLKLRTLIAAHNPDDPSRSLSTWFSSENRPFEMTHRALNEISQFLTAFASP